MTFRQLLIIDSVNDGVLSGWFQGDPQARVVARIGDELIASADKFGRRDDFPEHKNRYAFLLKSPRINLKEIIDKRLEVSLISEGDVVAHAKLWEPFELAGRVLSLSISHQKLVIDTVNASSNKYGGEVQRGAISKNNIAIAGRFGVLFLYEGSNNLRAIYETDYRQHSVIDKWKHLFHSRHECIRKQFSIDVLNILMPEKSSVLHDWFPYSIESPSSLWTEVVAESRRFFATYDCLKIIKASIYRKVSFRQLDTHLSTIGAFLIVKSIIKDAFGGDVSIGQDFIQESRPSDLGSKFSEDIAVEEVDLVSEFFFNGANVGAPSLVRVELPAGGAHVGTRCEWTCSEAPIRKRVLCFGNSFFERGGDSTQLSWWFSRLFENFHFVWDGNFDYEIINEIAPDIVLFQTIERFMVRPPSC